MIRLQLRSGIVVAVFLSGLSCDSQPDGPRSDQRSSSESQRARADQHVRSAETLFASYRIKAAEQEIDAALAADPTHRMARLHKAVLLRNRAQLDEAADLLTQLRDEDADEPKAARLLAAIRDEQGRHDEAVVLFESLSFADRASEPKIELQYANALSRVGRLSDAADVVAAMLERDPWFSDAYLPLGQFLARMNRSEWADVWLARYQVDAPLRDAEYIARNLEQDGKIVAALCKRGEMAIEQRRIALAIRLYQQALQIDRNVGVAYAALARLSCRLERPDDLLGVLQRLPTHAELYGTLGDVHATAERFDEAEIRYREALALQPQDRRWVERLQLLQAARAKAVNDPLTIKRREIRDRMRGRPVNETLPELAELATAYVEQGEMESAREIALFVFENAAKSPLTAGLILRAFHRPEDAFVRLWACRQTLDPAPDAQVVRRSIVEEYLRMQIRLDAADTEAQSLIADVRTADHLVLRARVQLLVGRNDVAAGLLDEAIRIDPKHVQAKQLQGRAMPNGVDSSEDTRP